MARELRKKKMGWIAIDAICTCSPRLSYDIVCHGYDLKSRTQFHYGKQQKKRYQRVDPSLLFGIQSFPSDLMPAIFHLLEIGIRQAVLLERARQTEKFFGVVKRA